MGMVNERQRYGATRGDCLRAKVIDPSMKLEVSLYVDPGVES